MGDAALVGLLKSGFDGLSPQLQEAARWVIDHPADVALLTTREQARRAGVAPATMTRLAQRIGLKGYDEIRKLYAEAVRRRPESFRARAEELLQRRDTEGDAALVHDVLSSLAHHLQALTSAESIERFTAAAKLIAGAERVFCLGLRSSFAVAYIFHYVRSLFGASSVLVDGAGGTGVDLLRTIGSADVMLAISVKPYTRHTVHAARYSRARGVRIVAVTDSETSPLAAARRRLPPSQPAKNSSPLSTRSWFGPGTGGRDHDPCSPSPNRTFLSVRGERSRNHHSRQRGQGIHRRLGGRGGVLPRALASGRAPGHARAGRQARLCAYELLHHASGRGAGGRSRRARARRHRPRIVRQRRL